MTLLACPAVPGLSRGPEETLLDELARIIRKARQKGTGSLPQLEAPEQFLVVGNVPVPFIVGGVVGQRHFALNFDWK